MIKLLMYLYLMMLNSLGMGNYTIEESFGFKPNYEKSIAINDYNNLNKNSPVIKKSNIYCNSIITG